MPRYLLPHHIWSEFLLSEKSILGGSAQEREAYARIQKSALGLLRSYYYLIQHESDFHIACENGRLLPSYVSWPDFCAFSEAFLNICDDAVSERYHYGELRLTRLNLYAKVLLGKSQYERIHGQYATFFARFYGPLLFIFSILSIVLSAMQVELGVESLLTTTQWQPFWHTCRYFAIATLAGLALLTLGFASTLLGMIVDEWVFALKERRKRRKSWRRRGDKA